MPANIGRYPKPHPVAIAAARLLWMKSVGWSVVLRGSTGAQMGGRTGNSSPRKVIMFVEPAPVLTIYIWLEVEGK
jgi:hypothetical protein